MSIQSCTNNFDVIYPNPQQAFEMKIKAALMTTIRKHIEHRDLNFKSASIQLGLSEKDLDTIVTGNIHQVSLEQLLNAVNYYLKLDSTAKN